MSNHATPAPAYFDFFDAEGHPLNVPKTGRYHFDGGTVCGQCAVEDARKRITGGGWDTRRSDATLTAAGYERDPYKPGREDDDWCIICDVDYTV